MKYAISSYGDSALLINFDQKIDERINNQVNQLHHLILSSDITGIRSIIPSYCSLTVIFNTLQTSYPHIKEAIKNLNTSPKNTLNPNQRTKRIPICCDASFGLDLDSLCRLKDLSQSELIDTYCSNTYQVFMIGFLPGFPYMGKTPDILYTRRKKYPRPQIAKGAVGLAGNQTGIYPCVSPGGWQIIGNTPIALFDVKQKTPILDTGDQVSFFPINRNDYDLIKKDVESGQFNTKSLLVW